MTSDLVIISPMCCGSTFPRLWQCYWLHGELLPYKRPSQKKCTVARVFPKMGMPEQQVVGKDMGCWKALIGAQEVAIWGPRALWHQLLPGMGEKYQELFQYEQEKDFFQTLLLKVESRNLSMITSFISFPWGAPIYWRPMESPLEENTNNWRRVPIGILLSLILDHPVNDLCSVTPYLFYV